MDYRKNRSLSTGIRAGLGDPTKQTKGSFVPEADVNFSAQSVNDIIENINQTYRYFLTVTDLNGCKVTDDVFVRVDKEAVVFVATGFTPNNDNVNDYLYVQANEGVERVVAFQVFDRLGQVVFESSDTPVNDETFGWNGYFKNSFVNNGVFGWTLIVEFEDGERGSYQGNTTIIR